MHEAPTRISLDRAKDACKACKDRHERCNGSSSYCERRLEPQHSLEHRSLTSHTPQNSESPVPLQSLEGVLGRPSLHSATTVRPPARFLANHRGPICVDVGKNFQVSTGYCLLLRFVNVM